MKKFISLLLIFNFQFVIFNFQSSAQTYPSKYWIQFTDKNNSPFSISDPAAFLSQRAIDRRTVQNIPIELNDLPVNPAYIDSVRSTGVSILNRSKWFNAVTIDTTGTNDTLVLDKIQSFSFVTQMDTVGKWKGPLLSDVGVDKWEIENSTIAPVFSSLSEDTDYGQSLNQIAMIGGDILHAHGYRGEGIIIAVLDAGFRNADIIPAFDSLRANDQIIGTWDFVNREVNVFGYHSHGTWVLSTMAANLPGQIVGTAPKARYWLLRTEDGDSEYVIEEDNWVAGAEFADSAGADVFNTSLGYTTFNDSTQDHTYADMDGNTTRITIGADIAASKGILVVNAAGNEGSSSWHYIVAAADGDSVLAVGAVDADGNYAGFSSAGPSFDGRIKPNVAAQGSNTVCAGIYGGITMLSGTSVASPIISGMAACLWQANPGATNMQVFDAIQQSASQYQNPDYLLGYGIPFFTAANLIISGIDLDNDEDGDEVLDIYDKCPGTSILFSVDASGCPLDPDNDEDGDGVVDIYDKCPGTPIYLDVDSNGCPLIVENDQLIGVAYSTLNGHITAVFNSSVDQTITIELFHITGRLVYYKEESLAENSSNIIIIDEMGNLAHGIYIFILTTESKTYTRMLSKL
ncbi:MAG: S8 family serine peptidase [Bacteroidota bacterium]